MARWSLYLPRVAHSCPLVYSTVSSGIVEKRTTNGMMNNILLHLGKINTNISNSSAKYPATGDK